MRPETLNELRDHLEQVQDIINKGAASGEITKIPEMADMANLAACISKAIKLLDGPLSQQRL